MIQTKSKIEIIRNIFKGTVEINYDLSANLMNLSRVSNLPKTGFI